ncbi:ArsR/SmtB family transcription factor [Acetatifactor muris]|uniref:ArsR/SmtB family transcription factor n=1 Tax=Acetatifactor muris TaxID=879566 RepID=UPI0023EFA65B|nr:winged helix-turn-helix domain-containing protein [Acetatifactor muris]
MSGQWNMTVRPEPFWLEEVFACMNYVHMLDSEEWMNKNGSWSRRQKEEFLVPYRSYRGAMRARLQPILEQYSLLGGYVDSVPRERESLRSYEPPMMSFLKQMQSVLEAEEHPSEEELEKTLNEAFQRMLDSDLQKSPDAGDPVIRGLSDVMAALEGWEGSDADKFKLLRLYSERREVMEQLWSLQGPAGEIGRDCLRYVQERYDACMEKLRKQEEVESLLNAVGLNCGENSIGQITPAVMLYDQIMVQIREFDRNAGVFQTNLHLGLETFYLYQSRQEDLFNDERLLAGLKALSDPTRLKILHLLVERPCYLQEMAKELELTPATVLHHLGLLMSQALIEIQVTTEKKKVYYRVNRQGLEEVSQGILQLELTREEREEQVQEELRKQSRNAHAGEHFQTWTM